MALDLPTKRVRRWVLPASGNDAELDFRLAEPGIVGGQDEVAHHGEFAAAAQGIAGHRRDHRLAALADPVPGRDEVVDIALRVGQALHLGDVGAGRESLVRAGDDDRADCRIPLEDVERAVDLGDELAVQRVQGLWPVERDQADLAPDLDEDGFIGRGRCHGGSLEAGALFDGELAGRARLVIPSDGRGRPASSTGPPNASEAAFFDAEVATGARRAGG